MTNDEAWNFAIGIVQAEGVTPSKYFLELIEREKAGEITGDDIRRLLTEKYAKKDMREYRLIFCPNCEAWTPDANYCGHCGKELHGRVAHIKTVVCSHCGQEAASGVYCGSCGKGLEQL